MMTKNEQVQQRLNDLIALQPGGSVTVEVTRKGKHGPRVIKRRDSHNLIVNNGKYEMWNRVMGKGVGGDDFHHIAFGTSGAAVASNQTGLLNAYSTSFTTCDRYTMTGTRCGFWMNSWPSGVGSISVNCIKEMAILPTGATGSLNRSIFTSVDKTEDDKLKITYETRTT
jgi:hypothetical protein